MKHTFTTKTKQDWSWRQTTY